MNKLLYFSRTSMLQKMSNWIDQTNAKFSDQQQSCAVFKNEFKDFYPKEFLESANFVVTDKIPKPDFSELRALGLGDFIDMPVQGVSYKNTYFIRTEARNNLRLHFHELVHVAQWRILGTLDFIERYISEIQSYGYDDAPLEIMANSLDAHFAAKGPPLNVPYFVQQQI